MESANFCQPEVAPPKELHFQSAVSFVLTGAEEVKERAIDEHLSDTGKTSPLDFLASLAFQENEGPTKWNTLVTEGRERITVVAGPAGTSIRLHKGNGRLPPVDLTKPFAKKCRNRECNNLGGQLGKPRSIYCSKRCQSREQNLRQGRIKNVRSPTPTGSTTPTGNTPRRSSSPRSSPSPVSMLTSSSPVPLPNASPSPSMMSSNSPLALRGGLNPSPISLSPVQMGPSSFSPIPMSSSIPSSMTPILLPRPTQPGSQQVHTSVGFTKPTPQKPQATLQTNPSVNISNSSFSPSPAQQKKFASESMENLTLAPILSSN